MSDDPRLFPIQGWRKTPRSSIPWWLAEVAYVEYVSCGFISQSLEELATRGGFGRGELLALLRGGRLYNKPESWPVEWKEER